jgi:ElaB/YqjD/DUF883 family membrane-anchored ribosome-binding protein
MGATPDELKENIERTRAELAADVDALSDRVNPAQAARRQVGAVKAGATGLKDRVMGTAGDAGSAVGGGVTAAAGSAADAVTAAPGVAVSRTQGNPLAAGLIAFGAGLLTASVLPSTRKEQELALQVKDKASDAAQPVVQAAKESAQQVAQDLKPAAQQAVEQVKETATDAAQTTTEQAKSAAGDVAETTQESAGSVKAATTGATGATPPTTPPAR